MTPEFHYLMNLIYRSIIGCFLLVAAGCTGPHVPEHRILTLHGRILDQHGQPVPNIRMHYIVSYMDLGDRMHAVVLPNIDGHSSGKSDWVQSGPEGRFSIHREYGYGLRLAGFQAIERPYYVIPEQEVHVGDKVRVSSPNRDELIELASTSKSHPVTIKAWKIESPEEQIGVFGKSFRDLKVGDAAVKYKFQLGEIRARVIGVTGDGPIVELQSPDGGLQPVTDFYGFEAPDNGYQSRITFIRNLKRHRFYFRRSDGQGFAMVQVRVGQKPQLPIFGMHLYTYSTRTRSMHLQGG